MQQSIGVKFWTADAPAFLRPRGASSCSGSGQGRADTGFQLRRELRAKLVCKIFSVGRQAQKDPRPVFRTAQSVRQDQPRPTARLRAWPAPWKMRDRPRVGDMWKPRGTKAPSRSEAASFRQPCGQMRRGRKESGKQRQKQQKRRRRIIRNRNRHVATPSFSQHFSNRIIQQSPRKCQHLHFINN